MNNPWELQRVRFRFQMGEKTLLQPRLSLLVYTDHFLNLPQAPEQFVLPKDRLESQVDGLLVPSQPIGKDLPNLSISQNLLRYVPHTYNHYYLEFTGTFDKYLGKFSQRARYNLRSRVKKFAEASGGKNEFSEHKSVAEMAEFYRVARSISEKTFQEKLLDAGLPASKEFEDKLIANAEKGLVRGYLLFQKKQPVAYLYCSIKGKVIISERTGYDPVFKKSGPGAILHFLVFERLFDENAFQMFDFSGGQAEYKEFYSTGFKHCADIYYLLLAPKTLSVVLGQRALSLLSKNGVQLLERMGVKEKVKLFLRGHTPPSET